MKITRQSPITGKLNTLDLPITEDQLNSWWRKGEHIQKVMLNLTPMQREFLISGIFNEEEWGLFII